MILGVFLAGVAGSLVHYFIAYRDTRIRRALADLRREWITFVFDILVFLACGGLVAVYLVEVKEARPAFVVGLMWPGIIRSYQSVVDARVQERLESRLQLRPPNGEPTHDGGGGPDDEI